jgi:cytosine/adenosine deaminase-related metal-dependent hydrolase
VAESALEFEMYMRGEGEMFEWIRRSGRNMSDCGRGSPVRHLERCGLLRENLLAIHVNYLARGDAGLLRTHRVHVVHCPRSHQYFRHEPFPLRRLLRAGVNVCLGTDSLASVWKTRKQEVELSMFDEMRTMATREAWLPPRRILEMATVNSAQALGLGGQVGELSPGAYADVIALPLAGEGRAVVEAVLHHRGEVRASLIDGRWARKPQR